MRTFAVRITNIFFTIPLFWLFDTDIKEKIKLISYDYKFCATNDGII